jgi:regulator of sirC expression with transglutaminase-like and TPR domain
VNSNITWQNFYQEINRKDAEINLEKASLSYAQVEYPDLKIDRYLNILDTMAEEVIERLPDNRYPLKIIQVINQYLFDDLGFNGNRENYYDPRNSFLDRVIERRVGIPITLSVIYLAIAKRIDFPMVGIGMPGHFLIRPDFEGAGIFVDALDRGQILFERDCEERLSEIYQQPIQLESSFLQPVSNRQILARMLTNLKLIYLNSQQLSKALEMIQGLLILFPESPKERRDRGLLYYHFGEWQKAAEDLEIYLAFLPNAEDSLQIRQLLQKIVN